MGCCPVARWLTRVGDVLHGAALSVNHTVNNLRRAFGRPYWPLTEQLKLCIGPSLRYIEQFERHAAGHARAQGYDGVVCGHIHRANLWRIDGHALRQHRRLGRVLHRSGGERARRARAAALAEPAARGAALCRRSCRRRRVRIALASDAWTPQTNGVVTTLKATTETLTSLGHEVRVLSPHGLRNVACPSYAEIRLALSPGAQVERELKAFRPHAIHIATEGPLGLAVRRYCRARGFTRLHLWRRGVDLRRFRPLDPHAQLAGLPRPISSAMIARMARRPTSEAGDAN